EIGGDYYDFIPLPGGRLAMMLGDVAGKGAAAALLMAKVSADARFCALTETDPAVVVGKLNRLLHETGQSDRFGTLVAALLNHAEHTVTLINAGHPAPLLYRQATGAIGPAMDPALSGLPLGVVGDFCYPAYTVALEPGDCIMAFTDGVTEAMDVDNKQLQMKGVY